MNDAEKKEESNPLTTLIPRQYSFKKPKTYRYPSMKGVDPKFRRNHKFALHGTMIALVRKDFTITFYRSQKLTLFQQRERKQGKREVA